MKKKQSKLLLATLHSIDWSIRKLVEATQEQAIEEDEILVQLEEQVKDLEDDSTTLTAHCEELRLERDELLGIIRNNTESIKMKDKLIAELRERFNMTATRQE